MTLSWTLAARAPRPGVPAATRPRPAVRTYIERAALVSALLLASGTIAARASDCTLSVPTVSNEQFDPALVRITNVDQAMALLPSYVGAANPTRSQVALGIGRFLRQRFHHGYSAYRPCDDWVANLAAAGWSHLGAPVLPDHILRYSNAACSQQAIVFQEMLRRSGIDYGSVRFDDPGHFAVAARTEKGWQYFDSNQEPVKTGVPLAGILHGRALGDIYPRLGPELQAARDRGDVSFGGINEYPAAKAALFHRLTGFGSSYGWAVFALLFLGLKLASWRPRLGALPRPAFRRSRELAAGLRLRVASQAALLTRIALSGRASAASR